jgi:hypothetical protein
MAPAELARGVRLAPVSTALVTPLRSLVHDAIHLFGVRRLPAVTGVDQRR